MSLLLLGRRVQLESGWVRGNSYFVHGFPCIGQMGIKVCMIWMLDISIENLLETLWFFWSFDNHVSMYGNLFLVAKDFCLWFFLLNYKCI